MRWIKGLRRLIDDDDGVTHSHHNGTIDTCTEHTTACGILFGAIGLPNEGTESSLPHRFRVIDRPKGPVVLIGTLELLEVTCMMCLVRMRSWNP